MAAVYLPRVSEPGARANFLLRMDKIHTFPVWKCLFTTYLTFLGVINSEGISIV